MDDGGSGSILPLTPVYGTKGHGETMSSVRSLRPASRRRRSGRPLLARLPVRRGDGRIQDIVRFLRRRGSVAGRGD